MLQEIRFCAVPKHPFPFPLHVQQLVCLWPTYDGYAKNDLEEDLDEDAELAWSQIISQAIHSACQRMGWTLSTLEYRKTPTYWESEQRTWHLVAQQFDADFLEGRESFGHELYLHILGPQAVSEDDFFPDDLPLLQWLHANHGFLFVGSDEAVLWAHFPHPELFLGEIKRLAGEHDHQMVHSKVPFRTFKEGKVDYVELPEEEEGG